MNLRGSVCGFFVLSVLAVTHAFALDSELRNKAIMEETKPPELTSHEALGRVRPRSYPMVAPTIPHSTEGFILNKDFNQCMSCHGAELAPMVKAPAVGESHYKNREGEYLKSVSPRRYFCTQCHVPQFEDQPTVVNNF